MRILFLSTYFRPDIASTGVLMTELARELAALGHRVTVVTSMPHYGETRVWESYRGRLWKRERDGDLEIWRVYVYAPGEKARFSRRLLNYATFNLLSGMVGFLLRRQDVLLVPSPPLTNGICADLIRRLRGTPFVYNVQDIWPDVVIRAGVLTSPRAIALTTAMERYVYQRSRGVTVISEDFRRILEGKGVPPEKISVIPNFFDTDFVRPAGKENSFSHRHGLVNRFVVLFAGNVGHSQGLETLLEAARRLEGIADLLFLVVGNGAARASLERSADEMGLGNVRFLPYQPHEILPEMYAAADVGLVPLRKGFSNDSVPCKVFTIMSAGRPIVASIDEGSDTWRLVTEAECGLCSPPEDATALADRIQTLYRSRPLAERLGRNGRSHVVEHYNPRTVAHQYDKLLRSVVDAKS